MYYDRSTVLEVFSRMALEECKYFLHDCHGLEIFFKMTFDESNLRNIRQFYLTYPKRDAVRHELRGVNICNLKNPRQ